VGVAWEPSNKMMLFLPPRKIKCLSLHPLISSLNLLFIYSSSLSFPSLSLLLWLSFRGLRNVCLNVDLCPNVHSDYLDMGSCFESCSSVNVDVFTSWAQAARSTLAMGSSGSLQCQSSCLCTPTTVTPASAAPVIWTHQAIPYNVKGWGVSIPGCGTRN
jgi:hypothetical protein